MFSNIVIGTKTNYHSGYACTSMCITNDSLIACVNTELRIQFLLLSKLLLVSKAWLA